MPFRALLSKQFRFMRRQRTGSTTDTCLHPTSDPVEQGEESLSGTPIRRHDPTTDVVTTQTDQSSTPKYTDTAHTALNVLKFSLETLDTVSNNIPLAAILSSVIGPILDIVDRIEQTSANKEGLAELAARIELLAPIVSEMAENNPVQGQKIIEALEREFESIARDLATAREQGRLSRFFNSADTASSLSKHNCVLAQLIGDFFQRSRASQNRKARVTTITIHSLVQRPV
ncbi:hypothetical protein C8R43DRAFT_3179 [Mycena crocata]|nr:hypothetical protein C8R43DRAFT_3179 [Mycena crocata]